MLSIGDVVVRARHHLAPGREQSGPGHHRGNSTSADFFVNGVRDDVQYYRDLYNIDRVEALKGPNAMIFGRGGAGGVINRVEKEAGFQPLREVAIQGGMYGNKRVTADLDQPINGHVALRLNGMFERSDSFRSYVDVDRYGIAPSMTIAPSSRTKITLRYEHLNDTRVADRGIPSFQGRPVDVDPATYYGNPDASNVKARVNLGSTTVEHRTGRITIRNQTVVGDYDRFYQNFVPGTVTADQSQVALSSYNNDTARLNVFNQTDVTSIMSTGRVRHTVLAGTEFGRQLTDNFRNTGFFNNTATSILVPYGQPTIATPVTFRQGATDADNHLRTNVAAVYGQDQVELSRYVQVLAGLRFDRFELEYHNNRNGDTIDRPDNLVSPRAGVVFKPIALLSLYSSYSVSYVPSSGDQFSSLTTITEQVEPERLRNYEVGAKWDAPRNLSLTTAVYRLDRTNTRSTDPNDPTRIVQTGSQRTNGYELGEAIRVGVEYRDMRIRMERQQPLAPRGQGAGGSSAASRCIDNYQIHPRLAAASASSIAPICSRQWTTRSRCRLHTRRCRRYFISPGGACRRTSRMFSTQYYINADNNTNISLDFPRTLRMARHHVLSRGEHHQSTFCVAPATVSSGL